MDSTLHIDTPEKLDRLLEYIDYQFVRIDCLASKHIIPTSEIAHLEIVQWDTKPTDYILHLKNQDVIRFCRHNSAYADFLHPGCLDCFIGSRDRNRGEQTPYFFPY